MMRRSQSERMEVIHLVEHSEMPVSKMLKELDVPPSTFCRCYQKYQEDGCEGLADRKPSPREFWNRDPSTIRKQVVKLALDQPDKSPRQLAWYITDTEDYFISE